MAELRVEDEQLVVRLSAWEKMAAIRNGFSVPIDAVAGVAVEEHPFKALRGVRAPGLGIPGVAAYGTWRWAKDRKDFVALHGPGPGLRVELTDDAPFGAVVATVADPQAVAGTLRRAAGLPEPDPHAGTGLLADQVEADAVEADEVEADAPEPDDVQPGEAQAQPE